MSGAPKVRIGEILRAIDREALRDIAIHQLEAGHSVEEVIDDIVETIDAIIPWSVIGPAGIVIEAIDGPIAKAVARLIVGAANAHRKRRQG